MLAVDAAILADDRRTMGTDSEYRTLLYAEMKRAGRTRKDDEQTRSNRLENCHEQQFEKPQSPQILFQTR